MYVTTRGSNLFGETGQYKFQAKISMDCPFYFQELHKVHTLNSYYWLRVQSGHGQSSPRFGLWLGECVWWKSARLRQRIETCLSGEIYR